MPIWRRGRHHYPGSSAPIFVSIIPSEKVNVTFAILFIQQICFSIHRSAARNLRQISLPLGVNITYSFDVSSPGTSYPWTLVTDRCSPESRPRWPRNMWYLFHQHILPPRSREHWQVLEFPGMLKDRSGFPTISLICAIFAS